MTEKVIGFQINFDKDTKIRVLSNNEQMDLVCQNLMDGKYETGIEIDTETKNYISSVTEIYAVYSGDNLKKVDQPDVYFIFHVVGLILDSYAEFRHQNTEGGHHRSD